MEKWIKVATECGFSETHLLDVTTLLPLKAVRDMCAEDKCHAYGKNWTCPPACGTLEECHNKMKRYQKGILLKTAGKLDRVIDSRGYLRIEAEHMNAFYRFAEKIRTEYPDALCLAAGGCRLCSKCAYPDPCRFPEQACSSMEAYGLFITQVCRDNGVLYYHGEKTICYFACALFEPVD